MRNLDFHYWLFGEVTISLTDKGERVRWLLYGKYDIALTNENISFCKTENRRQTYDLALGTAFSEKNFDPLNVRRKLYTRGGTVQENKEKRKGKIINRERITNISKTVDKYSKTKTERSSRRKKRR